MALGQFCPIRAMDQRQVRHDRYFPVHALIDDGLARCICQMIVAADDMGDAHVMVVHDNSVHIGRIAVGT